MYTKTDVKNAMNILKELCADHPFCRNCPMVEPCNACHIRRVFPDKWDVSIIKE